jgi:hypothetical protein
MKLMLTDDDGTILDHVELTRDEFAAACESAVGALTILRGLGTLGVSS